VVFNEQLKEEDLDKMANPIIGISYSAGADKAINFASNFPGKFSAIIMISPAGTREIMPNLITHCFLFSREVVKLILHAKWKISWEIIKESVLRIILHPRTSFQEIEKIRRFRLYEEILQKIYGRVDFAFIFSSRDSFLPAKNLPQFIHGRFIVDTVSSGHFGLLEEPGYYWTLFRDL
jgi:hypothetical protein